MNLGGKPTSLTSSASSWKSSNGVSDQFPVGLRVLVVDDDPTCLRILEKMLRNCLYEVTKCNRAEIALQFLRDNRNGFDIVISDVHMPDMDGFKLLEHVGLEMDLPVIMMSADDSKNVVMKGVTHGACDYLIKPVRMEALKTIWQHVVRKKKNEWKERDFDQPGSSGDGEMQQKLPDESSANEGNWKSCKKRKDEEDEASERDDTSALKKPRVVWSVELHQQFVTAVNQLGIDKAVPKKILELMTVPGLTRENVASHLQKYRLYLRRLSGVSPHANGLDSSFIAPSDTAFGQIPSLNGLDFQAFAASSQFAQHSFAAMQTASLGRVPTKQPAISVPLVDQRNSGKQMNLLHGIPTNLDSKQLASFHPSVQAFGNMSVHGHSESSKTKSSSTCVIQPQQPRTRLLNEINSAHVLDLASTGQTIPSSVLELSVINGHEPAYASVPERLTGRGMVHDENSLETSKGSRSFFPSYDAFSEQSFGRNREWSLLSSAQTLEAVQNSNLLATSSMVSAQPGFPSNQKNGQNKMPSMNKTTFFYDNSNVGHQLNPSLTTKTERLRDVGFKNEFYPQHLNQNDLTTLFKQQHEGTGSIENMLGFDEYHFDNLHA